jgi:3-hydroxy-9,10-secoandrosta-1,3,5(10)-triene-9,17-dione monooxygenase reductase component
VLVCVGNATNMGQVVHSAAGFSVNILTQDQQALSTYFAGGWKEPSPPTFSFASWDGGPLLDGCVAALGCTVETIYEGGDHWIVIGRVRKLHRREPPSAPLVFCAGRYAVLDEPAET